MPTIGPLKGGNLPPVLQLKIGEKKNQEDDYRLLFENIQAMINIFSEMTQKGKPVNKALCLAIAAILGLASCSAERVSNFPSYKLKIIQGNELNPRAVVSLRQGMTRDQVQLLLGTPLLRDAFHADRWDYTFNTSRNGIIKEQSNLTLYFENDILVRAEGDAIQKSIEAVQAGQNVVPTTETKAK